LQFRGIQTLKPLKMIIRSILALTIFFPFTIAAQITNNIKKVGTLNIYGNGKTVIGQIIINQTIETKVFLTKSSQKKDTGDIFLTTLSFDNKAKIPMFGVDISLDFDGPVLSVEPNASAINESFSTSNGNKHYQIQISQVNRFPNTDPLSIIIKSKTPVFTKISGIDGILE
jgi:hypothetical protein